MSNAMCGDRHDRLPDIALLIRATLATLNQVDPTPGTAFRLNFASSRVR